MAFLVLDAIHEHRPEASNIGFEDTERSFTAPISLLLCRRRSGPRNPLMLVELTPQYNITNEDIQLIYTLAAAKGEHGLGMGMKARAEDGRDFNFATVDAKLPRRLSLFLLEVRLRLSAFCCSWLIYSESPVSKTTVASTACSSMVKRVLCSSSRTIRF